MAAIIQLAPDHQPGGAPARRPERPHLTLVEGGRSSSALRRRAVYRQRRLAVLTAVVVGILVGWSLLNAVVGTPAIPSAGRADVPAAHVVRRGDTLWSIAQSLGLGGDVRDVVGALTDENGSAPLVPGHVVRIPDSLRW